MNTLVVQYQTLRKLVGLLGVSLPIVLPLGLLLLGDPQPIRESISAYHGTMMRDPFVGLITAVGTFLFAYKGYDDHKLGRHGIDDIVGKIVSFCAALVAFCPVEGSSLLHTLHLVGGTGMFAGLAYFPLFLFTRTSGHVTVRKRHRNRVYRFCGSIMVGCMAVMGVYWGFFVGTWVDALAPEFWLEALMLLAFGVSWGIKGEVLLSDR